jgi:hypothetical protein
MYRFLSRSDEGADLTRRATGGHRKRTLCSTLRRLTRGYPLAARAGRSDDFVAAVENLCLVWARSVQVLVNELFETLIHGDTGLVIEGQDLHENHSRNFLLRIHPEVGVGQT